MVIAPSDFRDEEFVEPYEYFTSECQWDVTVASTTTGLAKGMFGHTHPVEETIADQQASDYDALIIVGGMGSPTHLWNSDELLQLVREFNTQGKLLAAICISGVIFAKTDILQGKKATVWECPESLAAYQEGGAIYMKEDVVTDGHIVTANGPHAATPFAQEVARQLQKVTSH